jgi:TonB-linked SusC/RagA family outer membrane protein
MKNKTTSLAAILLLFLCNTLSLSAQTGEKMKGKVVDTTGETLPGVTIQIAGSTRGAVTDLDGYFEMDNIPVGTKLVASYLGMENKEFHFQGKDHELIIVLESKTNELDEVTVVAFAKQKKESVIAAVTTIKPGELKVPSSNLTTALAGRISGIISYQRSGEPGQDNADFFVRGITTFGNGKANPLILIDGVELSSDDLARLNTDDIASFSVMKDANATALYGARGANGVILVTTKEGTEGKTKFSLRIEDSFSQPTHNIQLAGPGTYMQLFNEAKPGTFNDEKIAKTGTGNPNVYPAIDWAGYMLKNITTNQRVNLNISGGGKVARYYIAASYSHDSGMLKEDERNEFNNNISLKKYLLRSNININITPSTELITRLHGTFDDYSGPLDGGSGVYNKIMRASPVRFPPYYTPDAANQYTSHILFGNYASGTKDNPVFYINPYADMVRGSKDYSKSLVLAQIELKQDLEFLLKGLSARGLFNTTRYSNFALERSSMPYYYSIGGYDKYKDTYILAPLNEQSGREFINEFDVKDQEITTTIYWETALQYNNTFDSDHHVSGLLIFTGRQELRSNIKDKDDNKRLQLSYPYRNLGLSGRLTYAYKSKYFIEGNFGYNGSERFVQSKRFGFFPSIGGGYLLSNEDFWEPLSGTISKLKLKATYGLVGNDAIGENIDRFFYRSDVNMDNGDRSMNFGLERAYYQNGISISRYANPDISWETAYKQNYGIELGLFNKLELQADYFREIRKDILQERADVPTTMGLQSKIYANIGQAAASGVDLSLDYSQSFTTDCWLTVHSNFTYAHSKYIVYEEPVYPGQPWRLHTGQPLKQQYGLIAERLFIDENDVANSPEQLFGLVYPGDIKYKDINMDDKIDDRDKVPIGYPTDPEIIYGGGFSIGFRNFDLSAFFQGSARSSFWINTGTNKNNPSVVPFVDTDENNGTISENALLQAIADNHWSETNRDPHALWPRLDVVQSTNNTQYSTWFMRDGSFIRLKTLEIGYTIPKHWTKKIHLGMARLYFSGTNLLTFGKFKLWDPEMGGGGLNYPVQRVYNIGINIQL